MATIRDMCDRVAWIDDGRVREIGPPNIVCGHYETELTESFDVIKELAESGVPTSQNMLGCIYRDGDKVEQDLDLAVYWFEEAIKRDDDNAKINLADMIVSNTISDDWNKALELYMSAAQKGNRDARNKLSNLLTREKSDIGKEVVDDFSKILPSGNHWLFFDYAELLTKIAWNGDDRTEAFKWYMKSAENGNINAMYQISMMYKNGNGPKKDDAEHLKWLHMAADGVTQSQLILGDMYRDGIKLESNEKEAFRWYEAAAKNNNPDAIYQIAMMCREGRGVEKSIEESDRWFKLYFEHSLFRYINILADSFSHSRNGVYNPDLGMKWYSVNAKHNNPESEYQVALLALNGKNSFTLEKSISFLESAAKKNHFGSANQLLNLGGLGLIGDKILKNAIDCMEKIAKDGNPWAANVIGRMYADGRIVEVNTNNAIMYLKMASHCGISVSMQKLGEMYRNGTHVDQNVNEAIMWFRKGIVANNVWSAVSLVNMYGSGAAEKDDLDIAIRGLENMSLRGDVTAMRMLGSFYRSGTAVEADAEKALKWLSTASKFGDETSKHMIGEMYRDGIGVEKNASEALKWFKYAAKHGNIHSILAIIWMREAGKADDTSFEYAMKRLEQLAMGGNVFAIRNLGSIYSEGKSVPRDIEKAKEWFKKSALLGDGFSRNKLKI